MGMGSMLDIKRRIKSVKGTGQITKAMNLVAAAKLQRARVKLRGARPYYEETCRIVWDIVNRCEKEVAHPLVEKREVKNTLVIVITGDRGLCGGYNQNIIKEAVKATENKENVSYITIGKKCTDFFIKNSGNILKYYSGVSENPIYEDASKIGEYVMELYKEGKVDEVLFAYTRFDSPISHKPIVRKIMPIDDTPECMHEVVEADPSKIMLYEPGEEELLCYLIPKYVKTILYGGLAESAACEQGARMTSMDSATKNANEAISNMTILYNRARQGAITQEITEIVAGANALQ